MFSKEVNVCRSRITREELKDSPKAIEKLQQSQTTRLRDIPVRKWCTKAGRETERGVNIRVFLSAGGNPLKDDEGS